jgi:CheY-like chemotaxis protein
LKLALQQRPEQEAGPWSSGARPRRPNPRTPPPPEGLSILIADDVQMNLIMLERRLKTSVKGCQVTRLSSGEAAVEAVTGAEAPSYDVLILDHDFGAGRMSGSQAYEEIRRHSDALARKEREGGASAAAASKRPLRVLCTSSVTSSARERLLNSGVDLIWEKTISGPEIAANIAAALAERGRAKG